MTVMSLRPAWATQSSTRLTRATKQDPLSKKKEKTNPNQNHQTDCETDISSGGRGRDPLLVPPVTYVPLVISSLPHVELKHGK